MGATDNLKIILTATEAGTAKRPHQAFLMLRDQDTGLETTFPFSMKESGKGKVDFVRSTYLREHLRLKLMTITDAERSPSTTTHILPTTPRHPPPRIVRSLTAVQ